MILNKSVYYRLWREGKLGNRIRMWKTIPDIISDSYTGIFNARHCIPASPHSLWFLSLNDIPKFKDHCLKNNLKESDFQFNEATPDNKLLIQGEIVETTDLHLAYHTDQILMREAMKIAKHTKGLIAKEILKYYCDINSYEMICGLLEEFPEHVIEFGVYDTFLGFIPRRNTIIWEIRKY